MRGLLILSIVTLFTVSAVAQSSSVRVTREPVVDEAVVFVLDYDPAFGDIDLQPGDIELWSTQVPEITRMSGAPVASAQGNMADMVVEDKDNPAEPQKQEQLPPNTGARGQRLKHHVIPVADVTGNVEILNPGGRQRMVFVSNLQGEGMLGLIVKGGTAQAGSRPAAPKLVRPVVPVGRGVETTSTYDAHRERPLENFSAGTQALLSTTQKSSTAKGVRVIAQQINIIPAIEAEVDTYKKSGYWRGSGPIENGSDAPAAPGAPIAQAQPTPGEAPLEIVAELPVTEEASLVESLPILDAVLEEVEDISIEDEALRSALELRIIELESKLQQRDDTLVKLLEEYLALKKRLTQLEATEAP